MALHTIEKSKDKQLGSFLITTLMLCLLAACITSFMFGQLIIQQRIVYNYQKSWQELTNNHNSTNHRPVVNKDNLDN